MTKRNANWAIWGGFALAVAAVFSYVLVFVQWPPTRDFPWINLLLFAGAGFWLTVGMLRAYRFPDQYRGRISGAIVTVLSLGLFVLFCFGTIVLPRQLPPAGAALRAGQQAPGFTLTDAGGRPVSLGELRLNHRAVLLIFYRGYW
jgi:hypothetical protein